MCFLFLFSIHCAPGSFFWLLLLVYKCPGINSNNDNTNVVYICH
uniref:Uncharacterized protein n=1 Tax=Anguilla anguilla TaxID=7936 RepID=A0A0E9US78_ANGAN